MTVPLSKENAFNAPRKVFLKSLVDGLKSCRPFRLTVKWDCIQCRCRRHSTRFVFHKQWFSFSGVSTSYCSVSSEWCLVQRYKLMSILLEVVSFLHKFDCIFFYSRGFSMEPCLLFSESDRFQSRTDKLERHYAIWSDLDPMLYRPQWRKGITSDNVGDTPDDDVCFRFRSSRVLFPFRRNDPPVDGRMAYSKHSCRFPETVENVVDIDSNVSSIDWMHFCFRLFDDVGVPLFSRQSITTKKRKDPPCMVCWSRSTKKAPLPPSSVWQKPPDHLLTVPWWNGSPRSAPVTASLCLAITLVSGPYPCEWSSAITVWISPTKLETRERWFKNYYVIVLSYFRGDPYAI